MGGPVFPAAVAILMRIALVAPFAIHPKGTTRWRVLPLARALAAEGHDVRVVIPPYDWRQHSGRVWRDGGVQVVNVVLPGALDLPGHVLLARRLAQAALDGQPDVVHCFKPKGYSGLAAWLLLQARARVVVDADDYEAGWNRLAGYPAPWSWFFVWQERTLLRRARAVTAASRWLESFAASLGQQQRHYLPNGVELSCSQYAMSCHRDQSVANRATRLRVLLFTRFVEHDARDVWQVWRQVLRDHPGAQLLVAGQGRCREEEGLAEIASAAGADRSVQIVGWLPPCTQPGLFAAVDAALLPVRDTPLNRAKSPMRLLDLLAAGVPVATQLVGEYGDLVQHGATGLVSSPSDPAALARSVSTLLADPGLRQRLGHAASQDVCARRAWPVLAQTALAAYRAVGCQPGASHV